MGEFEKHLNINKQSTVLELIESSILFLKI